MAHEFTVRGAYVEEAPTCHQGIVSKPMLRVARHSSLAFFKSTVRESTEGNSVNVSHMFSWRGSTQKLPCKIMCTVLRAGLQLH